MVSTKKGRSGHSTCYLHIISRNYGRNHSNTLLLNNLQKRKPCPKKTTAAKAIWSNIRILTVFFDILIANISWTVAQTPKRHIIFWKTVIKTFRSIYVNCFNTLRFLAEVSTKLQKMHFLDNLRTITQEGSTETRQMTPFFYLLFLL